MKIETLFLIEAILREVDIEAIGFDLGKYGMNQFSIIEEMSSLIDEVFECLKQRPFAQVIITGDTRCYKLRPTFFIDHEFKERVKRRKFEDARLEITEIDALVREVEKLREALKFYANKDIYNKTAQAWDEMWNDSGKIAREALEERYECRSI